MKKNHKWSILMWSVFLLLFISFSFIYISIQIKSKINEQYDLIDNISNLNFENSWTWFLVELSNSEYYKKLFQNSFNWILWPWESHEFNNYKSQIIKIKLINGYLKLSWNNNYSLINESFVSPWNMDPWIYKITWLWWYNEYEIIFDNWNEVKYPYNLVNIYKKIWNTSFLKYVYILN